jgi:hypothetical protein
MAWSLSSAAKIGTRDLLPSAGGETLSSKLAESLEDATRFSSSVIRAASGIISRPRISADEFGLLSVTGNWEFVVGNCGGASTTDGIDFSDTGTGGVEEGAET